MAFVFELPEVGEGVVEAEVAHWHVSVGDDVQADQPLCDMVTDKATLEITSPRDGRVTQLHGEPGDIIKVHTPLVTFDKSSGKPAAAKKAEPAAAPVSPAPSSAPAPPPPAAPIAQAAAPVPGGVTKATPAVRRHAKELGIDISDVPGTGPGGRVSHEDLKGHTAAQAGQAIAPPALPQVLPSGSEERIKLVGIRRKIAEQMVLSKRTAPHFTYVEEVDLTELVAMRNSMKPHAEQRGVKLTYIPLLMKACSVVFRTFPNLNAIMDEERGELVVKGDHHFGISCDTPNGLFVPVIRNVEQKSILHIAAEMAELVARTRAGQATREELSGSTFTITSVGSIGGVFATPILNHPEVAIMGFNAIRDRAMVIDGEIVVRKMAYLSPSFDHRVIDGAIGARFVAALKEVLEAPETLLLELS